VQFKQRRPLDGRCTRDTTLRLTPKEADRAVEPATQRAADMDAEAHSVPADEETVKDLDGDAAHGEKADDDNGSARKKPKAASP